MVLLEILEDLVQDETVKPVKLIVDFHIDEQAVICLHKAAVHGCVVTPLLTYSTLHRLVCLHTSTFPLSVVIVFDSACQ